VQGLIALPTDASQARRDIRQIVRHEFCCCDSLSELEEQQEWAIIALRGQNSFGSNHFGRLASVLRDARNKYDSGLMRNVWQSALEQLIGVEARRRMCNLAGTSQPSKRSDLRDRMAVKPLFPRLSTRGSILQGETSRVALRSSMRSEPRMSHVEDEFLYDVALKDSAVPRDAKGRAHKETRWRAAYRKYAKLFRIRREDLSMALCICGFHTLTEAWIDEAYAQVSKSSSLNAEEYLKFVQKYEALQKQAYSETFWQAVADDSGELQVGKVYPLIRRLGWGTLEYVVQDAIEAIDSSCSGVFSIHDFELLMESLSEGLGFTRQERAEVLQLFERFRVQETSHMDANGVAGALSWLGHATPPAEVKRILREVDVDESNTLDPFEFLLFMSKVREREIEMLADLFREYDVSMRGKIDAAELEELVTAMGYVPDSDALEEAIEDADVDTELSLADLWKVLKIYRGREGLTRGDVRDVDHVIARYAIEKTATISTNDVGKALRYFGYQVPFEQQRHLTELVDVDCSGRIDARELRKLIRMSVEEEAKRMRAVFVDFARSADSELTPKDAAKAFRSLGFIDSLRRTPVLPDSDQKVDMNTFVHVGIEYKRSARMAYRQNACYSAQEMLTMQRMFKESDTDGSGTISVVELASIVRQMFPIISASAKSAIDELMQELDPKSQNAEMEFLDFTRMMRTFYDIQVQEKLRKEEDAIKETGFVRDEVHDFRELFLQSDVDGDEQLTLLEVIDMVRKTGALDEERKEVLIRFFHEVTGQEAKAKGRFAKADFADFLLLMKRLSDSHFMSGRTFTASGSVPEASVFPSGTHMRTASWS